MGNNEGSISVPIRYKMNYNSSFNDPYLLSRRRNSTYKKVRLHPMNIIFTIFLIIREKLLSVLYLKRIVVLPPWRSDFSGFGKL
ncbi:hypothetical protein YC2023_035617 [Brassica napus]